MASTLAVFSLIAIRNWIVAGVFAPSSTELGITLLGGNEVPPGVAIDLATRAPFYQRFGISDHTATVIEYAITAPGLFASNLGRKALFALGFYEPYAPGWGYSPVYIAVVDDGDRGVVAVRMRRSRAAVIPVLLPALIALTQFVAVVIVYPKGERLNRADPHDAGAVLGDYGVARAANSRSSDAAAINLIVSRITM